jgi:hypothetical protein
MLLRSCFSCLALFLSVLSQQDRGASSGQIRRLAQRPAIPGIFRALKACLFLMNQSPRLLQPFFPDPAHPFGRALQPNRVRRNNADKKMAPHMRCGADMLVEL